MTGWTLESPLQVLRGIGPRTTSTLAAGGIRRLVHLVLHVPRGWEDRRRAVPIVELREGEPALVEARVTAVRSRRSRGRGSLVEADLEDASGRVVAVWFNARHQAERLPRGTPVRAYGRPARRRSGGGLYLAHPDWQPATAAAPCGVVPVYPAVGGITGERLRRWVAEVLEAIDLEAALPDRVPAAVRRRLGLPTLAGALLALHRPAADADLGALAAGETPAHHRLVFGELWAQQVALAERRRAGASRLKPHRYRIDDAVRQRAREALPFKLTPAQKRVLREIVADLQRPAPMRRLLHGDVGSGKTVVAALAMLVAAESGVQAALLAPTELLAEQHAESLRRLFGGRIPVPLLTASEGTAAERRALARGELRLVVGTHALLQEPVAFSSLGLVVVDEQHRFGVAQREALAAKGADPDLLVMSATPIPQSLALTLYGDLELSVLDALPPGRRPVETMVVGGGRRREVYGRLRATLAAGGQGYVVFPRIDDGEAGGGAALGGLGAAVRERFGELAGVVHGRMPRGEREEVMERFRRGELRLLLATTVIEVGVDVPAATAMVIESAERFGLAQLHQLRGRVGRGAGRSWCAAIHGAVGEEARRRLEAFARLRDGFAIAEADLELRGPGDVLGERQAGLPPLRFARLPRDLAWVARARAEADALLAGDAGQGQ